MQRFLFAGVASALAAAAVLTGSAAGQAVPSLPTSEAAVIGRFARGPVDVAVSVDEAEFGVVFGSGDPAAWPAEVQARQYFANGGARLHVVRVRGGGSLGDALRGRARDFSGLHALEPRSDVRVLLAPELSVVPAGEFGELFGAYRTFAEATGIFLIVDPPPGLASAAAMTAWATDFLPDDAANCAVYFPYLRIGVGGSELTAPASGAMAAVYVQSDADDGIWSAPAGVDFPLDALGTTPALSAAASDSLTPHGINAIREFAGIGVVPWGARHRDLQNPESRHIPVERTADWIAACLRRGLAPFAAARANDETLWTALRGAADDFFLDLYGEGAFAGTKPSEAFFVRCDDTTMTATDIAAGRVVVLYGIALVRPSEFIIRQMSLQAFDPNRTAAPPKFRIGEIGDIIEIDYATTPGFDYVLESISSAGPQAWFATGSERAGDGAWRRAAFLAERDWRQWRVRVTPVEEE